MKTVPFREIGPSFNMRLRRDKMAGTDLFKDACKKPKIRNVEKKRADKHKFTNALGEQKAKVFLQQQDIAGLALRKYPGLGKKEEKKAKKKAEMEAQDY